MRGRALYPHEDDGRDAVPRKQYYDTMYMVNVWHEPQRLCRGR